MPQISTMIMKKNNIIQEKSFEKGSLQITWTPDILP